MCFTPLCTWGDSKKITEDCFAFNNFYKCSALKIFGRWISNSRHRIKKKNGLIFFVSWEYQNQGFTCTPKYYFHVAPFRLVGLQNRKYFFNKGVTFSDEKRINLLTRFWTWYSSQPTSCSINECKHLNMSEINKHYAADSSTYDRKISFLNKIQSVQQKN